MIGLRAALALGLTVAAASPAAAVTLVFDHTYDSVTFVVPVSTLYTFDVFGAQGGRTGFQNEGGIGGKGAQVNGRINLTAGTVLTLVVGGKGGSTSSTAGPAAGGGGGSFVLAADGSPIFIAGGGGGASRSGNGGGGRITSDGGGLGGEGGGGNFNGGGGGGGGMGIYSPGEHAVSLNGASGGGVTSQFAGGGGACGGSGGGFGGGGGGSGCSGNQGGGGGGGGYSGGSGGFQENGPGQGGESYGIGFDPIFTAAVREGDGQIIINYVTRGPTTGVPEPANWALLIGGFGAVGFAARRRRDFEMKVVRA